MRAKVHVVGAGLAGLAAAVALTKAGRSVALYEASGQAGGRCRSYVDAQLDCLIDNGNHLLLSGNKSTLRYLADIGADNALTGPLESCFPFFDLRTGERWLLRPNRGFVPWWIFSRRRRVPGTSAWEHLSALRVAVAGPKRTVGDCVGSTGVLYERFWEPLAVSALNTPVQDGAACLLWAVLRETFAKGGEACQVRLAKHGLSAAFVDPAIAFQRQHGAGLRFGWRLRGIEIADGRACRLRFGSTEVELDENENLILAVPPAAATSLLPSLVVPVGSHTIVNAHFRLAEAVSLPGGLPLLGLIGGTAQWLFARGNIVSVTVSAADHLGAEPADSIARTVWKDVATALGLDGNSPPAYRINRNSPPAYRIVKEKRATFAQTPRQAQRRPATRSEFANLYLAGDWIDTGLPATIEGAIRSGQTAAAAVLREG